MRSTLTTGSKFRDHLYTSPNGNRIVLTNAKSLASMKNTTIYLNGDGNTIRLDGLVNVINLNVVCIKRSTLSIGPPVTLRGLTVISSSDCNVKIGANCLSSRDVLVYASNAHGLFSVKDGSRKFKNTIEIGGRVWLGQGARVLSGAQIGEGFVIGSFSVLAGKIPNNCAAAGNPCRVTSRDVFWTSRTPEGDANYFEMLQEANEPMPAFVRMTDD